MSKANLVLILAAIVLFAIGFFVGKSMIPQISGVSEGFAGKHEEYNMSKFTESPDPLPNLEETGVAAGAEGFTNSSECIPDPSKYVLRSTIPPCKPEIDLSKYMLKTECPSVPDMSKYVLKSSIPKQTPCVCVNSKPAKVGACPPPQRCPTCPPPPDPKPCPACPEVIVKPCDSPKINCKAEYKPEGGPRPMLSSMSAFGF